MVNFIRLEKASWASVGKPQWLVDSEFYQPLNITILPSIIFAIIIFFENLSWFKKNKQQKYNHMKNVYLKMLCLSMCSAVYMWMSTVNSSVVTLNWQFINLKTYEVLP